MLTARLLSLLQREHEMKKVRRINTRKVDFERERESVSNKV